MENPASRTEQLHATRLKPKHWLAGAVLAVGLFGAPIAAEFIGGAIAPAAADEVTDESRYIEEINNLRVANGLQPLVVHPELTEQARAWATELRTDDELSHASDLSIGMTGDWVKLGENVGVGPSDRLPAIFDAFVTSPAHYDNLMDPDFRFVGVGVVYDDEGRMWTTHRFMALAPDSGAVAAGESTTGQAPDADTPQSLAFRDTDENALSAPTEVVVLADLFGQLSSEGF